MDLRGGIAVSAFLISLVALLVTTLQLLRQLFDTTDGYRKCAESVVGVWHRTRRRTFRPYELSFETSYVTPQISLLSPQGLYQAREDFGDDQVHLLNSPSLGNEPHTLLIETAHPSSNPKSRKQVKTASLRQNKLGSRDEEKGYAPSMVKSTVTIESFKRNVETEVLVTWVRLLKELHQLYSSYWPIYCGLCQSELRPIGSNEDMMDESEARQTLTIKSRTDAIVIYRRWNWDFMPPEMIRPLATSTLGDIVILAVRLGMQWRALKPENARLQADGNGYSLSATEVRGLGIVFRFAATGFHNELPRLVPSGEQDKLLCGIVPGCPDLVKRDFKLVGDNWKCLKIDGILSKIGLPKDKKDQYAKCPWQETYNEVIQLLCPSLPLEGSTIGRFYFSAWHETNDRKSVFRFWEGRLALKRGLEKRMQEKKRYVETSLLGVYEYFENFEKHYANDFYCRWDRAAIPNHTSPSQKTSMLNCCRDAFGSTTRSLKNLSEDLNPQLEQYEESDQLQGYLSLIAAHVSMSLDAFQEAEEGMEERKKWGKDSSS